MTSPSRRIISLFGDLRVTQSGQAIALPGGVPARLVVLLALHQGQRLSREQIGEMLWPGQTGERQRRALSDGLYRLRRAWGEGWLDADGAAVSLAPGILCDVRRFRQLAGRPDPADWQAAVDLYAPLVPALGDEWLFFHRQQLAETYAELRHRLARAAEKAFDHETALRHFRALRAVDPLREEALRGEMRALAAQGRHEAALAVFEEFALLLDRELGVEPMIDTRQLQAQILLERESLADDAPAAAAPLVGRRRERAALLGRLRDGAAGRGGATFLLGEAGIGKTRLLDFLADSAAWRGWQVVAAGGQEFAAPGPYAPLDEALRRLLPRVRIQQLAQLVDHQDLAALSRLVPAVADVMALPPLTERDASQQRLLTAVGRVVAALAELRPQLLLLDDLHWAGDTFWPLLAALIAAVGEVPLLVVGAARLDELRVQPAGWAFAQQLEEAGEPLLHLHGLDETDLAALVRRAGAPPLAPPALAELHRASGGNPLIAHALLATPGGDAPLPRHEEILRRRLDRLSGPARLAIQAAAILGDRISYDIWAALMTEVDSGDMPFVAGELEQARLLLLDDRGYRFAHDTLRHQVMTAMPDARRRLLHRRALAALTGRSGVAAATLAYHAAGAGDDTALITHAIQAGHEAAAMFAHHSAIGHFQLAWTRLPGADPARFAVGCRLAALYGVVARRDEQEEVLGTLEQMAGETPRQRVAVARLWSSYFNQLGQHQQAADVASRAVGLARSSGEQALLADVLLSHGQALRTMGQPAAAAARIDEAARVYQAVDDGLGVATTVDLLGGLAYEMGDYETAAARHGQAAATFRRLGHPVHEALALNNLGTAYWGLGAYAAAREAQERALAINRAINHRRGEADNLDNMGGVDWVLGRYDEAIAHYRAALAIRRAIDDRWGISISLGNLGSAHRLKGEYAVALRYFEEAYALNVAAERLRGQCYNRHGQGLTLLAMGRLEEARRALEEACGGRETLGERDNLLESRAGLLRWAVAAGNVARATALREQVGRGLEAGGFRPSLRQWCHFACYEADRFLGRAVEPALLAARRALEEMMAPLTADERATVLRAVPLNRDLQAAVDAYTRRRTVTLPAREGGAPTAVVWTVAALDDEAVAGRGARRRAVLARLLAEAAAQGAVQPPAALLADVLGVSRRTIQRDLRRLVRRGAA